MSDQQPLRVLHYLNQFFGGIGGEEQAGHPPELRTGPAGPGRLLNSLLGDGRVEATLVCGDNFFQEQPEQAAAAVREAIEQVRPDVVVAGPAFLAGRYGIACAEVCSIAAEEDVPALTGMHVDNPAVPVYSPRVYIVGTGRTPAGMQQAVEAMVRLARKLAAGQPLGPSAEEGYLPRGQRRLGTRPQIGAVRAVDMLVAKLRGQSFASENPYQPVDHVPPAPPLTRAAAAKIALITTGGLIRRGNPDQVPSSNARRYVRFDVSAMRELSPADFEAYHAGYFNALASGDPNYILPLRYARMLEEEGAIGGVHPLIYAMPGVATPVQQARQLGAELANELRQADVGGALLVAT